MGRVVIKINGLEMVNFDPLTLKSSMNLNYDINGEKQKQIINVDLTRKSEILVEGIMRFIKSQGANCNDERDDILENLYSRDITNIDKAEEKLLIYLSKLCEKIRFMKNNKNPTEHMKLYHEINGSKITL